MAVLHELNLALPSSAPGSAAMGLPQADAIKAAVLKAVAAQFWVWFDGHSEDVIYTVRIWVVTKAIRVRELRPVFVLLFGER